MEIRSLHEGDDRATFRSGNPDLDRYLQQFAGQNQFRHHLGVTYVAIENRRILGYATVAAGHIEVEDLPAATRRKLPAYPLPILRLARLAVDESARDRGLGSELLKFVLQLPLRMAGDVGCVGLVVDAKAEAVGFYSRYGFAPIDLVEGESESRPRPTPMFLSLAAIRASRLPPLPTD